MLARLFLIPLANRKNLFGCELASSACFSGKNRVATFCRHLAHVLYVRTEMKVVWAYAKPVRVVSRFAIYVARMTNFQTVRDSAEVNDPTRSVGVNHVAAEDAALNRSISCVGGAGPNPATGSSVYLAPKSFEKSLGKSLGCENRVWVRFNALCEFALARLRTVCDRIHRGCFARYGLQALPRFFILCKTPLKSIEI
jgi:hypothetical protein